MTRRGWTLHEMLISLGVMSGVMAIAAHAATSQLRFFTSAGELAALRGQIGQASAVAATMLWGVSPIGGDILIAQDSAIEVRIPVGTSFACGGIPGRVTMAAGTARGMTLGSFTETPDVGDRIAVLFEDSLGTTWLTMNVAARPEVGAGCAYFPGVSETRSAILQEQITVPAGAPMRFSRLVRLSLYRGSDNRWYLGSRDWNGTSQRFNTIQPVAGPLRPYSQDPRLTGLAFVYRDSAGFQLASPVEPKRVASITIVSRATSARFEDSTAVSVALRNAR